MKFAFRGQPRRVARGIEIVRRLPAKTASVPEARDALAPLEHGYDSATFETVRLLVSELVANSVRHSAGEESDHIKLAVSASEQGIRVEVSDGGTGFTAAPRLEGADQASGWGLHLVDVLSDRWGTESNGRACVWFELVDSGASALTDAWATRAGD